MKPLLTLLALLALAAPARASLPFTVVYHCPSGAGWSEATRVSFLATSLETGLARVRAHAPGRLKAALELAATQTLEITCADDLQPTAIRSSYLYLRGVHTIRLGDREIWGRAEGAYPASTYRQHLALLELQNKLLHEALHFLRFDNRSAGEHNTDFGKQTDRSYACAELAYTSAPYLADHPELMEEHRRNHGKIIYDYNQVTAARICID